MKNRISNESNFIDEDLYRNALSGDPRKSQIHSAHLAVCTLMFFVCRSSSGKRSSNTLLRYSFPLRFLRSPTRSCCFTNVSVRTGPLVSILHVGYSFQRETPTRIARDSSQMIRMIRASTTASKSSVFKFALGPPFLNNTAITCFCRLMNNTDQADTSLIIIKAQTPWDLVGVHFRMCFGRGSPFSRMELD